jgi:cbb3-type cytochrome oxidase subunit 1
VKLEVSWDTVQGVIFYGVLVAILGALGYVVVATAKTDGRITYCFVESNHTTSGTTSFRLYGHREWRTDATIYDASSFEEALSKAEAYGCKIEKP